MRQAGKDQLAGTENYLQQNTLQVLVSKLGSWRPFVKTCIACPSSANEEALLVELGNSFCLAAILLEAAWRGVLARRLAKKRMWAVETIHK